MTVKINVERPDSADGRSMIDELERYFNSVYGEYDGYGASPEQMIADNVAFFVLREDGRAAACGGVKLYGTEYGELKRIFVRPGYRGKGYGRRIVDQLAVHAQQHGVGTLCLETGAHQPEAIAMYERLGFERIPRFGDYPSDPLSVYFQKQL